MSDATLPRIPADRVTRELADRGADAPDPTVVGVLLAAGTSSRFGDANKLLATLDGDPLVRRAARTLREADLDAVVAVVGYEASAVRDALDGLDLSVVENPDYEEGIAASVRTGVAAAADAGADAAVFLPGDMPLVSPDTVRLLVDAYRAGLGDAFAAGVDGRRGNPVLFGASEFAALRTVEGDVGGRSVLFDSDGAAVVETDDDGVAADVDTVDDLRAYDG